MRLASRLTRLSALALGLAYASASLGCATEDGGNGSDDPGVADDFEVIPDGKVDNYRSSNTQEFSATATAVVALDASFASKNADERLAAARELVSAKLLQIGWFLNLWVSDKEPEDVNKNYGSYHAMARASSVKALEVKATGTLTFSYNFEATIAAGDGFLAKLPGRNVSGGGKMVDLNMGLIDNATLLAGTWQSSYGVHSWDPSTVAPDKLEILPVLVKPAPRSANAFLNYAALYADGKLTVGAQFGWDYNEGRQDLANARQLYDDLVRAGFTSPVTKYDDLKLGSGPLTRTSLVGGNTVDVEVTLIHPGMVASASANAAELRAALLDLLATREVILFNGHAGVSGRLLPADFKSASAGNILASEYPTLRLLPGYQLLLIEGCQTYATFTDGFRKNPAKRGPNGELVNMDIVTSTSYTWTSQGAEAMEAILWPLVGRSARSAVKASTWDDVLRTLNAPPNNTSFLGVNGIDNDPHAHPFAKPANLGKSCTTTTQCGGDGNMCMRPTPGATRKVCGTVCLDDAGCGSGYRCQLVANAGTVAKTGGCIKR